MSQDLVNIRSAISRLEEIKRMSEGLMQRYRDDIDRALPAFRHSAINLIHYLALRQFNMEETMELLGSLGLSRLFKAERDVAGKLEAVLNNLKKIADPDHSFDRPPLTSFQEGSESESAHTSALLGPETGGRKTRIMVTLPSDAAFDDVLIRNLLEAGINCFRINCAHDGPEQWKMMIDRIHSAKKGTGRDCRICMDLGGPKFRTGHMRTGPKVIRLRPEKNEYGIVVNPEKFWIAPADHLPEDEEIKHIPVERSWYDLLKEGDTIRLKDARGKTRRIKIIKEDIRGKWGIVFDTTYIRSGTLLHLLNDKKKKVAVTQAGELIPLEERIVLRTGDRLLIHKKPEPGEPAILNENGTVRIPAHISCPLEEIFRDTRPGERILLDDGKIEGVIEQVDPEEITVRITWAEEKGSRLAADKGINLPDSELKIKGLTEKDLRDLEFVSRHADIVNVSFVKNTNDLDDIREALKKTKGEHLGLILKIETQQGYDNLPHILLKAMQFYPVGVMIARGDLAVEVGWQKLAEVQEEILKLCSAAHIPDIWATQVLETLAKKGRPSRAEITDAAMAQRADCVMLNKGPHILQAIKLLDEIIRSMQKTTDDRKLSLRQPMDQ